MEVGTSRADDAGVPCYLETGTQSNIDFYTKRGFEIVGQTEFLGHTLTGMVRQPRDTIGSLRFSDRSRHFALLDTEPRSVPSLTVRYEMPSKCQSRAPDNAHS